MKFLTLMLAAALACGLLQPAAALALTEDTKCLFRAQLLVGKFGKCLAAADAKVTKGRRTDTLVDDQRCANKFAISWWKNLAKAQAKEPSENLVACEAATTEEKLQSATVTTLLAFDRDLDDYEALEATDLDDEGEIQKLIDSNNQAVCEEIDGTWAGGNCTASYNCAAAAICSYWAEEVPFLEDGWGSWANNYVGHEAGVADAVDCDVSAWNGVRLFGAAIISNNSVYDPGFAEGIVGLQLCTGFPSGAPPPRVSPGD